MTYEDRLRELSEQAEGEPWETRLLLGPERPDRDGAYLKGYRDDAYLKGYQVIKVAEDEMSYKRLASTTPTEDRWLPGSKANVDLMTFQRNSAEKVAEAVATLRVLVEVSSPGPPPEFLAAVAVAKEALAALDLAAQP